MKQPRIGSCWRIGTGEIRMSSVNYDLLDHEAGTHNFANTQPFDELVIVFQPALDESAPPFIKSNASTFHLEQMNDRNWYLGLGDIQISIQVRKDGSLDVMQYGGPDIREGMTREAQGAK